MPRPALLTTEPSVRPNARIKTEGDIMTQVDSDITGYSCMSQVRHSFPTVIDPIPWSQEAHTCRMRPAASGALGEKSQRWARRSAELVELHVTRTGAQRVVGQQSRSAGAQRSRITSGPIWSAHTVGPSYPIAPLGDRAIDRHGQKTFPKHGSPEPCIPRLNHPHPGQVALCQQAAETQHMEKSGSTQSTTCTRGRGIYQSSSTLPTLRGEHHG